MSAPTRANTRVLSWTVKTGVLEGARIPFLAEPLKPVDTAFNVLGTSVIGSILQHYVPVLLKADDAQAQKKVGQLGAQAEASSAFPPETASLIGAFRAPAAVVKGAPSYAYEARVLEGIWAAAPYLHNGSVPTLAELLKPAAERVRSFKIGPAQDLVNAGLASSRASSTIPWRPPIAANAIPATAAAARSLVPVVRWRRRKP